MSPPALLLVAAAIAAVGPAAANLAPTGLYSLQLDYVGECDDGVYPGQTVNMTQIWDEETQQTAFKGYINRTFDDFADDCQLEITAYRWGSTGGWSKFYELSFSNPFDFVVTNFPEVYKYIWRPLGFIKKPVPLGVYYLHRPMTASITLKRFTKLPYGKYKLYSKASKDGIKQTCFQMNAIVTDVGVGYSTYDSSSTDSEMDSTNDSEEVDT